MIMKEYKLFELRFGKTIQMEIGQPEQSIKGLNVESKQGWRVVCRVEGKRLRAVLLLERDVKGGGEFYCDNPDGKCSFQCSNCREMNRDN